MGAGIRLRAGDVRGERSPGWRRCGARAAAVCAAILLTGLADHEAAVAAQRIPPVPVRLHAEEGLERVADLIVSDARAWRPFPGIGTPAGVLRDTVEIWVARDLSSLRSAGLGPAEDWVAGVADPVHRRIALRIGERFEGAAGMRGVFRHELAHLALHRATGGNHPRWLAEGYAQYAAGQWGWQEVWHLQLVFFRAGAAVLGDLDLRFRRQPLEVRQGYLLAYTAVHELATRGGEAGLTALFARLRAGDTFDEALRTVLGLTEEQFESRWKRRVIDRYGLLYVLSRATVFWIAVSALVVFVSLRRARRDRRRLAALRAAEEVEERLGRDVDWEAGPE